MFSLLVPFSHLHLHLAFFRSSPLLSCSVFVLFFFYFLLLISVIFHPHFPPFHLPLASSPLSVPPSVSSPQALTCSPTARRSAKPWATPTAAGCRPSCRPTGARGRTTAATCTSPAWTPRCPTLRYPPPSTSPSNSP